MPVPHRATWFGALLLHLATLAGPAVNLPDPSAPAHHHLSASGRWLLHAPGNIRFDASALLLRPDGSLLTVNDKALPVCRIETGTNGIARLIPQPDLFPQAAVQAVSGRPHAPLDCEGLAQDDQGRLYVCEESGRAVFRTRPGGPVERLDIDWTPVRKWFNAADPNASFEGIAVGGNRLYVANERSIGRIIVVDLPSLKVVDDFQVTPIDRPARDVHYSDLCWWRDELWVLCRESRCILRVDPTTRSVKAQYDYAEVEQAPQNAYFNPLPYGFVEGLAVNDDSIWLVVDNNGLSRRVAPTDTRGLLFRCDRPDRVQPGPTQR